jgi:hypothetical protein
MTPEKVARKEAWKDAERVADEIVALLADELAPRRSEPWWCYVAIVWDLGAEAARAFAVETGEIERQGGMKVADGSRRRTPGGVFFAVVKARLGDRRRARLWAHGHHLWAHYWICKLARLVRFIERGPKVAKAAAPAAPLWEIALAQRASASVHQVEEP